MPARIQPGDVVDGFTVEGLLHQGGNGYLYRVAPPPGRDPGFPLLMKVPGVGRGEPTLGVVSFEVEQAILPSLAGTHVPRVVAVSDDPMRPYIVMEHVLGEGLADVVARAPLPAGEVARIGAAMADAVHDIHRQHVMHLDLKPENCMLRADGTVVLLDFGFSRHEHLPDLLAEDQAFAGAGSAAYVSPEQLRGSRSDARSDVFALGVMLYELATGEPPFGEPVTYGGMRDRLWRVPAPPRSLVPAVPPWLQEVILHCTEADAADRSPSAAHVAFDLRNPGEVQVTSRSEWTQAPGLVRQVRSWWRSRHRKAPMPPARTVGPQSPVILIAVDTENPDDPRHAALQRATGALVRMFAEYRLLLVSAIDAAPLGEGSRVEDTASGRQLEHRNRLRAWIAPPSSPRRERRCTWSSPPMRPGRSCRSRAPTTSTSSSWAPRRRGSGRLRGGEASRRT